MTLERSLDECRLAVRYFFNNQFDEARELMRPWSVTRWTNTLLSSGHYFINRAAALLTLFLLHWSVHILHPVNSLIIVLLKRNHFSLFFMILFAE